MPMSISWLVVLCILAFVGLSLTSLLFLKIQIEISFEKTSGEKPGTVVFISFFGKRLRRKLDFSKKEKKQKKETEKKEKLSLIQKIKKYQEIMTKLRYVWSKSKRTIRKNIFVEKLDLSFILGVGDAAVTGIATGSMWALVYACIGFLSDVAKICVPNVTITPDYENECFSAKTECIIEASPANIISIGTRILISYYLICRKIKKQTKKEKAAINNGNTN